MTKPERIMVIVLVGALLASIGAQAWTRHSYQQQIIDLANQVAAKDKTIENQNGVYEKLALQTKDLQVLLDSKDQQGKALQDQLKKQDQDLLTANQLVLTWKKAYEGATTAHQTEQPSPTDPTVVRKRVDFDKDFGQIQVNGWTLTDPAEAWVSVKQVKPLTLNIVVSQDPKKQWHVLTTSSDPNTAINVKLAAVNPFFLAEKWYEKLEIDTSLALGTGALGGVGASYHFGKYGVGPMVYAGISNQVNTYIGVNFSWRPFMKDE